MFEVANLAAESDQPGGVTMQLMRQALFEALDAAGVDGIVLSRLRVGVVIGSTVASRFVHTPFYAKLRKGREVMPQPFRDYVDGSPAECIRRQLELNGPAITVSNACTSGADAIGIGAMWITQGVCDLVIAGGCDELNELPLNGFHALGVCAPAPCRPFDAHRYGLNLGEGAACVILEPPEQARRRGRSAAFAVTGYGKAADVGRRDYYEPVSVGSHPDPEEAGSQINTVEADSIGSGLEAAIRTALRQAAAEPGEVGFVNAHGTGTVDDDLTEAVVLARVFGEKLSYMSTKSRTGHTLGAAGAIEFVLSCLMLESGIAVRNLNFETAPEDIPVAPLVRDTAFDAEYAVSTSLAFGGSNTALAIRRLI